MIQPIKSSFATRWLALPLGLTLVLVLVSVIAVQAMGGTISGTVSSPGGYPLPAGTVVKLFEPGTETVFGQANVDPANGAFNLGPVPDGVYILKAIPPLNSGFTQSVPVPVSVLGGPVSGVTLSLTTPQIDGTVVAPDGITPATATVKVLLGNGVVLQSVTAPGGTFAIGGLLPGSYGLQAHPALDEPLWQSPVSTVNVTGGATQSITLTLTAAQLWGQVNDHLGNPVQNAVVHAVSAHTPPHHHSDHSSPSGFWAIGGLGAGNYQILAEPPFNQPELTPPPPVPVILPGGATNPYTLTFGSASKIVRGKVTTNLGAPVHQALVLAHRVDKHGRAETLTAPDGRYQLHLSAGLWAMTVKAISSTTPANWVYPLPPQLVHFQHNTQPEEKTQNFMVVIADSQVVGRVEMPGGGTPPFTVTVALHNNEGLGRQVDVDPNGAFSLHVPHGHYKVAVHPHDPGFLGPLVDPIRVEPNSTYDLGTLTLLAKDAAITGTVRDSSGNGVEGIQVTAWRESAPDTLHSHTGPDGAYILPVVAGRWHVQPAPGPEQPYLYDGQGQSVSLTASQVVSDVDFDLVTADATINGQLVDESGQAIGDVEGWARAVNKDTPSLHNGAPIQAGYFSIYVPGGNYNVAAHLPAGSPYMSGATKDVSVSSGQAVTITLQVKEKDATIEGALWEPRKQAVVNGVDGMVGAWAEGNWAGTHIDPGNGTYRFQVAAGLWHLGYRIDPSSGYVKLVEHKNVPVQSGQVAVVPLPVVHKDGAIAGIVRAPGGQALAGVPVVARSIDPTIDKITLETLSQADGRFNLPVPYGRYRLGALGGGPDMVKPAEKEVVVRPGETSGGHVLQFQRTDATISGTLSIDGSGGLNGQALVWAWSNNGGFVKGRFPITNSNGHYTLNVISNTTWHLGAVFETATHFWGTRDTVTLGQGSATRDLILTGPHPKPAPVVVTFDAANPQRIDLADGTHIFIPAGAIPVSGQVTLRVVPIATLPHQQHANVYKYGYVFLATDSSGQPIEDHFNQDVIIAFTYEEAELVKLGILETDLKPAYFSTTTDHWTFPDSYAVDTTNNRVTMQIDHFTDFALTAASAETGSTDVYLPIIVK